MEKHFAALKIPDSDGKLTKAVSLSELSSTRRIVIEQCYRDNDSANLIRQYSCEQILDRNTQTSRLKFSELVRTGNDEHVKTWRSIVPLHNNIKSPDWNTDNTDTTIPSPTHTENAVEYMEVEDSVHHESTLTGPNSPTDVPVCSSEKSLSSKPSEDFVEPVIVKSEITEKEKSDCVDKNESSRKSRKSYQDMKSKIRPLVAKSPTEAKEERCVSTMCFNANKLLFLLLLPISILIISILLHQDQDRKHSIDFVSAVGELRGRVHGQDRAMQALSEYLQQDTPPFRVIVLVGGTGVGKSYTVEIIKANFPEIRSVHQYIPPIKISMSNFGPFAFLRPRLIILENLKESDLTDVVNFLKTREHVTDQYVTILAVFNVEQMDDNSTRRIHLNRSVEMIKNNFADANIDAKIIPFDSLSEDTLEKCIRDAAISSKLHLSDNQFDLVKQSLLTNNAGCKGAYSKVQVIGRQ